MVWAYVRVFYIGTIWFCFFTHWYVAYTYTRTHNPGWILGLSFYPLMVTLMLATDVGDGCWRRFYYWTSIHWNFRFESREHNDSATNILKLSPTLSPASFYPRIHLLSSQFRNNNFQNLTIIYLQIFVHCKFFEPKILAISILQIMFSRF